MKIRTKTRAGALNLNRNAKKLALKRVRGVIVKTGTRAGSPHWKL